jgi:GT2 family glycosyltransferase
MPVYNTNPEWLIAAVESVRSQIYEKWELCIADDASTDPKILKILENYSLIDPRVKVVHHKINQHISAASNTALNICVGEWVALLDHDDLLPINALLEVAKVINLNSSVQLIYSDEDKYSDHLGRHSPYFKCDWNIDLLYAQNYVSHLGVYKRSILDQIGGFRVGYEGSQDYDLLLRYVELIDTKNVEHIPKILYHWRVHSESTSSSGEAKPYAVNAGIKALENHLERMSIPATVLPRKNGMRRVSYQIETNPKVTLIIPTRDGLTLLKQCIKSIIEKTQYENYEIIVIDNGSIEIATLDYLSEIQSESNIRVIKDDSPFNYSALNNKAVHLAHGNIIGLINNDIEVISPDWMTEMVGIVMQPGVGAVGARLWYPNKTLQHGGVILGIGGVANHAHYRLRENENGYFGRAVVSQSFSAVTGACLFVKKSSYLEVNGLDEENLKVAFNDVDFCLKLRNAGYRNVWTPYAELFHHESATRGLDESPEKRERFVKEVQFMQTKWNDHLLNDPAYNTNLSLEISDFHFSISI